ncbi:hypothetical protein L7E55_05935 [Pelotomaculum isophthalicicum JI]|uniref:Glycosyltransferase n=1 Tax=Pelotomaculum isophthalicicum JI TaxID=947010 RepID=A0A9X4JVS2_9FIRM|nr:hypothetical protein [Pelotomaculum isophthalicicum]MDF9407902.1 hypothetical protein [Pelotomaculum isophthalicicum JI]
MPKFILIDHSIREFGGHYYEYAVHVLRAAKEEGLKTILATNRDFKLDRSETEYIADVYPVYKYDFWGLSRTIYKQYSFFEKIKSKINSIKVRLKLSLGYSSVGFLWLVRNQYKELLFSQSYNARQLVTWFFILIPLIYLTKIAKGFRSLLNVIFYPFKTGYIGNVLKEFLNFIKVIIHPLIAVIKYKGKLIFYIHQLRRIRAFRKATENLFERVKLENEDIIFIPTLSEVDLMGLLDYFKKKKNDSIKPSWNLVFRRNLYFGREPEYLTQRNNIKPLRNAFLHFKNNLSGQKVCFFTDTEKLTTQYNSLNIFQFNTLPIPVNNRFQEYMAQKEKGYPLKAVYAGDARREKGYQYLPGIIRDLWEDYVDAGKLSFLLQSNFAFTRLENNADIVFARDQLEIMPDDKIQVIKRPLSSDEYCNLILSGDIGLLFYDKDNYYARSSGALVEFLIAGKPVIVPAGTWLVEEFIHETYKYHKEISRTMESIQNIDGNKLKWANLGNKKLNPMTKSNLIFGGRSAKSFCWMDIPEGAGNLLISFCFDETTRPGVYAEVYVDQLDQYKRSISSHSFVLGRNITRNVSGLVRIDPLSKRIWLGFSNAFGDFTITISDITLNFIKKDSISEKLPLGVIGLAYSSPEQIPKLMGDMIDNYPHYQRTAQEFTIKYRQKHNANQLVKSLMQISKNSSC